MKLFDTTLQKLQASLDVRLARQTVLGGNLANVDTPGYRPRDLDFAEALSARLSTPGVGTPATPSEPGHPAHLSMESSSTSDDLASRHIRVAEGETGLDGNGVDLDRTMVELSRNALLYGASSRSAGKKLAILRYVASDGVG